MKKRHDRIKATVTAVEFKKKHGDQSFYKATLANGRTGFLVAYEFVFDTVFVLIVGEETFAHGEIEIAPDIRESVTSFPWKFDSWSFDFDDALPSWQFCEGRPSTRTRGTRMGQQKGQKGQNAVHAHAGERRNVHRMFTDKQGQKTCENT